MTPLLILSADWHVAPGAWRHKGVTGDAYHALHQIVHHAIQHGVDVVGAGDLYDTDDPDPKSVALVQGLCDALEHAGRKLYYIEGQHERHRGGGRWLGVHDMPVHLTPDATHVVAGLRVCGFDWTPPAGLPAVYDQVRAHGDLDLLVCHQVWTEFMGYSGEASLADAPAARLTVTGDYHVSKLVDVAGRRVLSPGSICMQSINEEPEKSFFVLDDAFNLHAIPLQTRHVGRFSLASDDDLEQFLADRPWEVLLDDPALPPNLRKPIVAVTFPDDLSFASRRLHETLDGLVHYFPRLSATRRVAPSEVEEAPRLRNLAEALDAVLPAQDPSYLSVRRLLETRPADLSAELAKIKSEFLNEYVRKASQAVAH